MASPGEWVWSEAHQDHYRSSWDQYGNPVYIWLKRTTDATNTQPSPPLTAYNATPATPSRHDSVTNRYSTHQRAARSTPEHITGTSGIQEQLDPSYYVRQGQECQQFFKQGRVLAMLWSEPAGATASRSALNDAFSVVKFGESVYTNIRRFVVVQVPKRKGFVYACGITTYSSRGVLKDGCTPEDHAAVYFTGSYPSVWPEEIVAGMTNESIEIEPSQNNESLAGASRINFGKTVAIEKNVKVKDIGRVAPAHMSNLLRFWNIARGEDDE